MVDSSLFTEEDITPTSCYALNIALGGELDGGITPGLTALAGPSKHFKTNFAIFMAAEYMKAHPKCAMLFYSSEFGSPKAYFESYGVDENRVIVTPVTNIELLKNDLMKQLDGLQKDDEIIIILDSLGNLASRKEVEDALNEKTVTDMTRAKAIKALFRMVTPILALKRIPMLVINHTYQTQEMFSKAVMSGGTGIMYSCNTVFIIGRQQDKTNKGLEGYHFVINVEKSRYVKEKSKIPITVKFDGGIQLYSGLYEIAAAGGYVIKPKNGRYIGVDPKTGELLHDKERKEDALLDGEFWKPILTKTDFGKFVREHYKLGHKSRIGELVSVVEESIDADVQSEATADHGLEV